MAGMTSRLVRSPKAPKMTMAQASGVLGWGRGAVASFVIGKSLCRERRGNIYHKLEYGSPPHPRLARFLARADDGKMSGARRHRIEVLQICFRTVSLIER